MFSSVDTLAGQRPVAGGISFLVPMQATRFVARVPEKGNRRSRDPAAWHFCLENNAEGFGVRRHAAALLRFKAVPLPPERKR